MHKTRIAKIADIVNDLRLLIDPLKKLTFDVFVYLFFVYEVLRFLKSL